MVEIMLGMRGLLLVVALYASFCFHFWNNLSTYNNKAKLHCWHFIRNEVWYAELIRFISCVWSDLPSAAYSVRNGWWGKVVSDTVDPKWSMTANQLLLFGAIVECWCLPLSKVKHSDLLFCRFWHFGRRSSCRVSESYRCRRRSWGCLDIG